ncbi:MAG: hypothetical protein D6691_07495 [Candidatus Hydrogenedentota bacterium]|nr:hypothetical protein [Candidatus Sumerlaea chitinivorans]RMH26795.1 MAG: hypothetical protein D6691_07495 [Candidatus Hydrogenedentota bacterium]GIX45305.1 MAG: arabinose kinase [Candidatus Sumerlaea sp.]
MAKRLTIAYYISSHGLGHASRAAKVMNALPKEARLIVKSLAPADFLVHLTKGRQMDLYREAWDFGAWQESNFEINWDRTFEAAMKVHEEATARLPAETAFLLRENVNVVVTDIPSTPLVAARRAQIPSVCLANFTWVEIFRRAATTPSRRAFLRALRAEYAAATLALIPGFALGLPYFRQRYEIPLIADRGKRRRAELRRELGVPLSRKVVLLYFGNWGLGEHGRKEFDHLQEEFSFVSLNEAFAASHRLDPLRWPFCDIVASVDVVLGKPGYGTMSECMANATPVVYYPRPEFAEYPALRQALAEWGGGVQITKRDLIEGRWGASLMRASQLAPPRISCTGARQAARHIVRLAKSR